MSAPNAASPHSGLHGNLKRELRREDITAARGIFEHFATLRAFIALAVVDVTMRMAGFHRFYQAVRSFPTLGSPPDDGAAVERVCFAVDRAATLYFKRAWCLQRSATVVCLLRLRGVPAELVIGVRKMPFYAHAWVEQDGSVLNDSPVVQNRYTVMERC